MDIHHLEQLPDEIREPVQNLIEELATIQEVNEIWRGGPPVSARRR